MDTSPLFVPPEQAQTGNTYLSTQYTLRACNRDARIQLCIQDEGLSIPELDGNRIPGKIAPLLSFDNVYGHWKDGITRVYPPVNLSTLQNLVELLEQYMSKSLKNRRLWDLDSTIMVKESSILNNESLYPNQFVKVYKCQSISPYSPFSVHPPQAYIESESKRGKDRTLFSMPSQSTVVTGIHGGLHNNTCLEMGFFEKEGTRDIQKRTYDTKNIGFVCAGHTAHSADAGKSRRVTSYTRVRIMHPDILSGIQHIKCESFDNCDWIVYCMGITCNVSETTVCNIVSTLNGELTRYYTNQFINFTDPSIMAPATYIVYETNKILYLSVSSGVLLRSVPGDYMVDSSMLNEQQDNTIVEHPSLPSHGALSIKYRYSPFFMMTPFVEHDRPPRTLFASGQTTQGIFFPWSPATARVSPLHSSRPIVATQFVRDIEEDHNSNEDAIWDVFAGEDLLVCYMNMDLNYDDSIVISSGFADRGGFATISMCTYRISESESIPVEGEKLCGKKYKWWKVDCTDSCICKFKDGHKYQSTSGRVPSGKVHKVTRTEDGSISIKVLSFAQILTGDKVSTMHGQKGVVRIVPQQDLPVIVMKDGSQFCADMYMAVGSIVSRQTNGQVYESGYGLRGAKHGELQTVNEIEDTSTEPCDYILDPITGEIIMRELPFGDLQPVKATIGITRVINQTQMTRERHHLTHRPEGKYSTGTHPGRADGGGVAAAEMDFHAMYSSGLKSCAQEIFNRGNACLIPVCRHCNAIQPLHDCGNDDSMALTIMSFDCAVFDQISAAVNGSCNRYKIQHI